MSQFSSVLTLLPSHRLRPALVPGISSTFYWISTLLLASSASSAIKANTQVLKLKILPKI